MKNRLTAAVVSIVVGVGLVPAHAEPVHYKVGIIGRR